MKIKRFSTIILFFKDFVNFEYQNNDCNMSFLQTATFFEVFEMEIPWTLLQNLVS